MWSKKPIVSLKILFCLARWRKLSRSKIESTLNKHHDHHVIWDAFERLEYDKMIVRTGSTINVGRREFVFTITEMGLSSLILEIGSPQELWYILLGYCYHMGNKVSLEKIKYFYQLFIQKYLMYLGGQRFTFELEFFESLQRLAGQN